MTDRCEIAYDAGQINDYGGGNVEWWQDYIRAELGHSHDHYAAALAAAEVDLESLAAEITAGEKCMAAAAAEIEHLRTALKGTLIEVQRFHHALRMNGSDLTAAALAPAIAIASAALSPRPAVTQDEMDDCYQGGTHP